MSLGGESCSSCHLVNCIDGVAAMEGSLLFATT